MSIIGNAITSCNQKESYVQVAFSYITGAVTNASLGTISTTVPIAFRTIDKNITSPSFFKPGTYYLHFIVRNNSSSLLTITVKNFGQTVAQQSVISGDFTLVPIKLSTNGLLSVYISTTTGTFECYMDMKRV